MPELKIEVADIGEISDGYHTFNELYYHRMMLFAVICNTYSDKAWKSLKHHDNTMYDNYFIVGITTPKGDYTYHYHKDHWAKFDVPELKNAPEWDGHKPEDITRLFSLMTERDYKAMAKSYIGETIENFFCNGFFGSRNYDMEGAEITKVYDSDDDNAIIIEVKKSDGRYDYGYFEDGWRDWQAVYEHLEEWTKEKKF